MFGVVFHVMFGAKNKVQYEKIVWKMRENMSFPDGELEVWQCMLVRPTCRYMTRELSRTTSLGYQICGRRTLAGMRIPAKHGRRGA